MLALDLRFGVAFPYAIREAFSHMPSLSSRPVALPALAITKVRMYPLTESQRLLVFLTSIPPGILEIFLNSLTGRGHAGNSRTE